MEIKRFIWRFQEVLEGPVRENRGIVSESANDLQYTNITSSSVLDKRTSQYKHRPEKRVSNLLGSHSGRFQNTLSGPPQRRPFAAAAGGASRRVWELPGQVSSWHETRFSGRCLYCAVLLSAPLLYCTPRLLAPLRAAEKGRVGRAKAARLDFRTSV